MSIASDPRRLIPELSSTQKSDLQRLWEVQTHDIVDVRPSSEATSRTKPVLDDEVMPRIARLHSFFLAFLQRAAEVEQHTTNTDVVVDESSRIKDVRQSCLGSFARLFLPWPASSSSSPESSSLTDRLRLRSGRRVLTINYGEFISEVNHFDFGGPVNMEILGRLSFGYFLYHKPTVALPAIHSAMALAVATLWRAKHNYSFGNNSIIENIHNSANAVPASSLAAALERFLDHCQLTVRLLHVTPQLPMADIKTGLVKKFIAVKGHVVKARPKRLRVATADFECQKCAAFTTHAFDQGRYSSPTKCVGNPNCRSKSFNLIRPTARYVNVQELRLQEAQEESTSHAGRTPRQIDVVLSHDLIDACRPGDIVLLGCYVDAINSAVAKGRAGKRALETSTYKLFLQGHSITTMSETNRRGPQEGSLVVYTQQQLQNITQLCHADHRCLGLAERMAFPFDLLVRSVCPSIIGHHQVKAGLLLCLLGGTPPSSQSLDRGNSIRSNSHILIVGDPGMGKSQMLLAANQLAARSVYVGGNTASTTGLTVTLTKEEGGETGIEAGALVLADQGVACIDELDKCKHLDGLLEAMEQQEVSIAKAGVVASLPARCSIIAAANPKHGSYNMSKTVAENLNMARPILSRFDLVYILRDRADKDQDRLVSSNIMNLYRQGNSDNSSQGTVVFPNGTIGTSTGGANDENNPNSVTLEKRLAWVANFNDPLPASLVRDYIAYAREYCKPKLTQEAAVILKEYYMNMRQVLLCGVFWVGINPDLTHLI
jgi:DNA helicase MCM8